MRLICVLLLTILLGVSACKRSPSPQRPKAERHEASASQARERRDVANRLKAAIERAAGAGAWIKGGQSGALAPRRADSMVEVLVASPEFEPVRSAFKSDCDAQGLETKVETRQSAGGLRSIRFSLSRGRQAMGEWRLREVRQLLRASIVIDDLGQDLEVAHALLDLPYPLTFSVLPRLPHSRETAQAAHRAGREVMLHLPMQPELASHIVLGDGALTVGMTPKAATDVVRSDLDAVPYVQGVNNHMGSLATSDRALMIPVMKVLAERRLYFVDSRTTAETVALDAARQAGIPAFYRSVFLDNTETTDYSLGQLRELCRVAREQGVALAIGHPYRTTVAALREFLPQFERQDIQLVPASELVRLPEVARLSPPRAPEASRKGK